MKAHSGCDGVVVPFSFPRVCFPHKTNFRFHPLLSPHPKHTMSLAPGYLASHMKTSTVLVVVLPPPPPPPPMCVCRELEVVFFSEVFTAWKRSCSLLDALFGGNTQCLITACWLSSTGI